MSPICQSPSCCLKNDQQKQHIIIILKLSAYGADLSDLVRRICCFCSSASTANYLLGTQIVANNKAGQCDKQIRRLSSAVTFRCCKLGVHACVPNRETIRGVTSNRKENPSPKCIGRKEGNELSVVLARTPPPLSAPRALARSRS